MNKQDVFKAVRDLSDKCHDACSTLWNEPEVAFTEEKSANYFRKMMSEEGFTIINYEQMPNAFCAEFGQGHPVISLLGEYDALPGLSQKAVPYKDPVQEGAPGHGCGHNLLGTACALTAIAIKKYLEESGTQGTIRFYGCPEEEQGVGKTHMSYIKAFEGTDFCLAWHPMTANRVMDTMCHAMIQAKYHFKGISSHAGFAPDRGRSAVDACELMNVGVNYLREHIPSNVKMHYAVDNYGCPPNIVPPKASDWFYIRSPYMPLCKAVYERVNDIARGAALMTGTEVEIELIVGNYEIAKNTTMATLAYENMLQAEQPEYTEEELTFAKEVQKNSSQDVVARDIAIYGSGEDGMFRGVCPRDHWTKLSVESGSDAGDLSYQYPMTSFEAACWPMGSSPHTWQATAANGTTLGEKGALFAAQVMAGQAFDLLNDAELRERATAEFHENVTEPYECVLGERFK